MKLIRFGKAGKEKAGVQLANGTRLDVSDFGKDASYLRFFKNQKSPKKKNYYGNNLFSFCIFGAGIIRDLVFDAG